jgi:DNA-directed RNA polymerase specialized sigma24 family protein
MMEELEKYLKALVYLQLEARGDESERQKTELLLARSGFTAREIAEFLGKSEAAASKAISRARLQEGS